MPSTPLLFSPGEWRRLSVPFHDLSWNPSAGPGGPLPSHPLASMTIHCLGVGAVAVDVAELAFLRPRASRAAHEADSFCIGGLLAGYTGGEVVHLAGRELGIPDHRALPVDQRGYFCFEQTPRGIYEIWADTSRGPAHDRRGALVEVQVDNMTLVLGVDEHP